MLNGSFFADREPKKSSAIQPHQQLGTVRIGALGNHSCVRNFSFLSDAWTCGYKKGRLNCEQQSCWPKPSMKKFPFEAMPQMVASCLQSHAVAQRVLYVRATV